MQIDANTMHSVSIDISNINVAIDHFQPIPKFKATIKAIALL